MTEETLGIIKVQKWKLNLVVTTERIVVAKGLGTIRLGNFSTPESIAERIWAKERSEDMKKLTAESILKADKKNYVINYAQIQHAYVNIPGFLSGARLEILTAEKDYEFTLSDKKRYKEDLDLLSSVLKDKLN